MSSVFFEPAILSQTSDKRALFFGGFFNQKFGTTNWTFPADRLIPSCKCAFRKTITAIEDFAALGAAFNNFTGAVCLRTADTNGFAAAVRI